MQDIGKALEALAWLVGCLGIVLILVAFVLGAWIF